jgi:hypothetical protein
VQGGADPESWKYMSVALPTACIAGIKEKKIIFKVLFKSFICKFKCLFLMSNVLYRLKILANRVFLLQDL